MFQATRDHGREGTTHRMLAPQILAQRRRHDLTLHPGRRGEMRFPGLASVRGETYEHLESAMSEMDPENAESEEGGEKIDMRALYGLLDHETSPAQSPGVHLRGPPFPSALLVLLAGFPSSASLPQPQKHGPSPQSWADYRNRTAKIC